MRAAHEDASRDPSRPSGTAELLLLSTVALSSLGASPWLPRELLGSLFMDDAFYYFTIARNLARGAGSTFDGLHATNGYHPLWLGVLTPLFATIEDELVALHAVMVLETAMIGCAALLLHRGLRASTGERPALLAALLLFAPPGGRLIVRSGMESALLLLLLVVSWRHHQAHPELRTRRTALALGVLLALTMLARLEAGLLLPVMLFAHRRELLRRPGLVWPLAAPVVLCGLAHAALNQWIFGSWRPVSALVKAQWAGADLGRRLWALVDVPWLARDLAVRLTGQVVPGMPLRVALALMLLSLVWLVWRHRALLSRRVRAAGVAPLLLGCAVIQLAQLLALGHLAVWYRVPTVLATAILVGIALVEHRRLARAGAIACVVVGLARVPYTLHSLSVHGDHARHRIAAADWLDSHAPADARVGSWNAGMLGYFVRRPVVNLDGLANDLEYYRRVVVGHDLAGYLRDTRITLLADQACGERTTLAAYLARTDSESLARHARRLAVLQSGGPHDCRGITIWALDPSP